MTTYLRGLLEWPGELTHNELLDLDDWLKVIEADAAIFGKTAEDTALMQSIKRRTVALQSLATEGPRA